MVLSHRPIHLDKEQHLRKTELGCPLVAIMSSFAIKPLFHSNFPPCWCEFLLPNKSYFYQRASSCKPAPPEESGEANQRSPKKQRRSILLQENGVCSHSCPLCHPRPSALAFSSPGSSVYISSYLLTPSPMCSFKLLPRKLALKSRVLSR